MGSEWYYAIRCAEEITPGAEECIGSIYNDLEAILSRMEMLEEMLKDLDVKTKMDVNVAVAAVEGMFKILKGIDDLGFGGDYIDVDEKLTEWGVDLTTFVRMVKNLMYVFKPYAEFVVKTLLPIAEKYKDKVLELALLDLMPRIDAVLDLIDGFEKEHGITF